MRFTLVFENQEEGRGASYDLLFAPCPIWAQGENWILNLNPENPYLQSKSVNKLIENERLQHSKKCFIIVHNIGHGDSKSLQLLEADLKNLGMSYQVLRFGEMS